MDPSPETNLIHEKIEKIMRQTDYTHDVAREKLIEHGYDEIAIIKSYLGVTEKPNTKIMSINQEIYKQLRYKLDSNMRDYKDRAEKGQAKKLY
jgi:hypothetical protein